MRVERVAETFAAQAAEKCCHNKELAEEKQLEIIFYDMRHNSLTQAASYINTKLLEFM